VSVDRSNIHAVSTSPSSCEKDRARTYRQEDNSSEATRTAKEKEASARAAAKGIAGDNG
jgi:hypothetical protein